MREPEREMQRVPQSSGVALGATARSPGMRRVLPLGVLWSLAERSRGATAVLIVAAVTVAFLVLRVVQLHG